MLGRSLPLGSTLLEHLLTHVAGVRLYLTDRRLAPNREQIVTGTEDDLRGKLVYAWREGGAKHRRRLATVACDQ